MDNLSASDPFLIMELVPHPVIDLNELEEAYKKKIMKFHPDRVQASQRSFALNQTMRINQAHGILKESRQRHKALLEHHGRLEMDGYRLKDNGFLMDMMEYRETIESGGSVELGLLHGQRKNMEDQLVAVLLSALERSDGTLWMAAAELWSKQHYLDKLIEDIGERHGTAANP